MVEVLWHEKSPEDVRFEFGDKELLLFRYLETYGGIGVDEFARIAGIEQSVASQTLVLLTRADVISLRPSEKGDLFVLNQQRGQATG
jgi:hypothetical protein